MEKIKKNFQKVAKINISIPKKIKIRQIFAGNFNF